MGAMVYMFCSSAHVFELSKLQVSSCTDNTHLYMYLKLMIRLILTMNARVHWDMVNLPSFVLIREHVSRAHWLKMSYFNCVRGTPEQVVRMPDAQLKS